MTAALCCNFQCVVTGFVALAIASKLIIYFKTLSVFYKRRLTICIPYFDVMVGLARSDDPESYASCSTATGRGSHAGQVKGDDPDKKGYPGPPGWGLGVGLTTPSPPLVKL
jgi:hypothetical protein